MGRIATIHTPLHDLRSYETWVAMERIEWINLTAEAR